MIWSSPRSVHLNTSDNKQDYDCSDRSCAERLNAVWWYWEDTSNNNNNITEWYQIPGNSFNIRFMEMKIRSL